MPINYPYIANKFRPYITNRLKYEEYQIYTTNIPNSSLKTFQTRLLESFRSKYFKHSKEDCSYYSQVNLMVLITLS